MDLLQTALMLSDIPAPSGFEQAAVDAIADLARTCTSDIRRTPAGSLLVRRPGNGRRIMLSTHADTAGLLTTCRERDGIFRFGVLGPLDICAVSGAPVVSTRGTHGVIGVDFSVETAKLTKTQLFLDAPDAAVSEAFVLSASGSSKGGFVTAPALTRALSAAILLDVLTRTETEADLTLVFSAQHMLGARDAAAVAFTVAPELAVTIDGIPARDIPGGDGTVALGGGAVVSHQAGRAIADPALTEALLHAAEGPVQHDFAGPLVSDLAVIQRSRTGVPTAAAGFAVRGAGLLQERAALADAEALSRLLQNFLLQNQSH